MEDTRGWKPKDVGNDAGMKGTRTGVNRHETSEAKISFDAPAHSPVPSGVPLDSMGNAVSNKGAARPDFPSAMTTDNAPTVPLSSFEGMEIPESGVRLSMEAGTQPDLHPREMRDVYGSDHGPKSSAVIRSGMGEVSREDKTWKKAGIPMSKAQHSDLFKSQGSEESADEDTGVQSKKGEFEKGRGQIKKGGSKSN